MFNAISLTQRFALRTVAAVLFFTFSANALAWTPALTISGTPSTTATVGQLYSFQPTGKSRDNRGLLYSISGKPYWASFNRNTGKLSGTPQASHVGTTGTIVISATDGIRRVSLPGFQITVKAATTTTEPAPAPTNTAPVISGAPATQVTSGAAYSFRASASDANGDALTFSVTNLPSWASFSASTGTLSGTPSAAAVGTYSNIQISVNDGKGGSASLPAFSITVLQAAVITGNVTINWLPPMQNTDGSALTNLAGYKIAYGTTRGGPYTNTVTISNPSLSSYVVQNLTAGAYYFVVTARNSTGIESALSNEASKTIN